MTGTREDTGIGNENVDESAIEYDAVAARDYEDEDRYEDVARGRHEDLGEHEHANMGVGVYGHSDENSAVDSRRHDMRHIGISPIEW